MWLSFLWAVVDSNTGRCLERGGIVYEMKMERCNSIELLTATCNYVHNFTWVQLSRGIDDHRHCQDCLRTRVLSLGAPLWFHLSYKKYFLLKYIL